MDDLTARIADLIRRYQVEFRRTAHLSEAGCEQATEPFRREIAALIAEHGHLGDSVGPMMHGSAEARDDGAMMRVAERGREAVVRAAVMLATKPPIIH
jgi:hypothetical protein